MSPNVTRVPSVLTWLTRHTTVAPFGGTGSPHVDDLVTAAFVLAETTLVGTAVV